MWVKFWLNWSLFLANKKEISHNFFHSFSVLRSAFTWFLSGSTSSVPALQQQGEKTRTWTLISWWFWSCPAWGSPHKTRSTSLSATRITSCPLWKSGPCFTHHFWPWDCWTECSENTWLSLWIIHKIHVFGLNFLTGQNCYWKYLVCIIQVGAMFWHSVLAVSFLKLLLLPYYTSTDFEVHR